MLVSHFSSAYDRRMKTLRFLIVFGGVALFPGHSVEAQKSKANRNEHSTAIANTAKVRLHARTMTGEEPAFRNAIDGLDAQAGKVLGGTGLVPAAVSAQTRVPIETLVAQQVETGLSFGELLVADSLAVGSGKSLARILAMRAKTRTWAELSLHLRINPNSLVARAEAAKGEINNADARFTRLHRQSVYGLDLKQTRNSQAVPRPFGRFPGG